MSPRSPRARNRAGASSSRLSPTPSDASLATAGDLDSVLLRSQDLGFLGPGPVGRHIEHGRALLAGLPERGRVLDLGSGGGLPGLVLAAYRPELELTLLEARQRADLRESFDAVVARSFGPPAVTAECAVGFLRSTGRLVVSEPPSDGERDDAADRWPRPGLEELGLSPPVAGGGPGASFVVMEKTCPDDRWPRRVGVPAKRPLWIS